jgi:hypothetical protein
LNSPSNLLTKLWSAFDFWLFEYLLGVVLEEADLKGQRRSLEEKVCKLGLNLSMDLGLLLVGKVGTKSTGNHPGRGGLSSGTRFVYRTGIVYLGLAERGLGQGQGFLFSHHTPWRFAVSNMTSLYQFP